ncbi:MAG: hypothetical protein ACR2MA_06090 [Egibacteraceae bacterium]
MDQQRKVDLKSSDKLPVSALAAAIVGEHPTCDAVKPQPRVVADRYIVHPWRQASVQHSRSSSAAWCEYVQESSWGYYGHIVRDERQEIAVAGHCG